MSHHHRIDLDQSKKLSSWLINDAAQIFLGMALAKAERIEADAVAKMMADPVEMIRLESPTIQVQDLLRDAAKLRLFVKQFEEQFRQPAAGGDMAPPANLVPSQPSPLKAIWDGVTSATAWTNTGAVPAGPAPGQGGAQAAAVGFTTPHAWGGPGGAAPFQPAPPAPPAASGFPNRPSYQPIPAPPGQFPVGAQTPLPIR
jgi:hypothetical protein